jgi:transcriptional regulator with XRE-family HTH domain
MRATFGSELRRLRETNGLSLTGLSRLVNYSCSWLSRIETGRSQPNAELAKRCDSALNAGGKLVNVAGSGHEPRPYHLSGLPAKTRLLTGREADARRLAAILLAPSTGQPTVEAPETVVVHGMPGVGKTALAVHVAYRVAASFPDGLAFVDLGGHGESGAPMPLAQACDRLLAQLGVAASWPPAHPQDRLALYRDRLHGRRILVILDDARDSAQVRPLLPPGPDCRVLVTSRDRLVALDEAERLHLGVLTADDSARLLEPSARHLSHEIAHWCGGLPLALRIIAARCRGSDSAFVKAVLDGLADDQQRLAELDDGERSAAAAFATSFDRLAEPERRLLTLVASAGGGVVDAGEAAVLSGLDPRRSRLLLARLADANLLVRSGPGGFGLHILMRDYATQRLSGDLDPADVVTVGLGVADSGLRVTGPRARGDLLGDRGRVRVELGHR